MVTLTLSTLYNISTIQGQNTVFLRCFKETQENTSKRLELANPKTHWIGELQLEIDRDRAVQDRFSTRFSYTYMQSIRFKNMIDASCCLTKCKGTIY